MFISDTTLASLALSIGIKKSVKPFFFASMIIGNIPLTAFKSPFKESSPKNNLLSVLNITCSEASK